jgi:hypothetical protein
MLGPLVRLCEDYVLEAVDVTVADELPDRYE